MKNDIKNNEAENLTDKAARADEKKAKTSELQRKKAEDKKLADDKKKADAKKKAEDKKKGASNA